MANARTWLGIGAASAAAAVSWRLKTQRERRRLLRRGDIVALPEVWTEVEGLRIHGHMSTAAATQGALPVVMIHGWGISGAYFLPAAERLAVALPVYVPDLPGHGRSEAPPRALPARELARVLLGWMDAVGVQRASLVGHSMGCQTAVEATFRDPSRVARLVLIGPVPDPAARSLGQQLRRFLAGGLHERPSLVVHLARDYPRMATRIVPEFRFMLEYPIEKKLRALDLPTLLVRGANDTMAPQTWLEQAARLLRTENLAVIPGAGHAVQYRAPDRVAAAILPFLRQARP